MEQPQNLKNKKKITVVHIPHECKLSKTHSETKRKERKQNMNKLFTKIAALSLGAAMAVGVGIAVSSKSKSEPVEPVHAASGTWNKISTDPVSGTAYVIVSSDGGQLFDGSQASIDSTSNHIAGTYGNSITGDYDGKSFTFTKSGSDWYIQSAAGTYIGRSTNSNGITTATSTGNSVKNTITRSNSAFTIKGTATRYLSYNTSSGRFRYFASGTVFLYEKAAAKTLDSISLSGTYPTSFTTGDTFDHTGLVVTAHYSDSTTANVSSSATFSGYNMSTAGNQTVTVSYTEGVTTKTATYDITVTAPTSPTISLSSSSFSGYTGQQFSVTATFANLTSDFAWAASGAGTISGGVSGTTGDSRDGTSTYSGTLTGAGTKTLSASGGGATTQTYTITITKTTVTLNKASTSISAGKSETLTATTNVGSVTWQSSNTSAATVSNGVVSVPSNATVGATSTITATSAVDTSVKATCTVTVAEAPFEDVLTDTVIGTQSATYTNSWAEISNIEDSTGAKYMMRTMKPASGSGYTMQTNANGYFVTTQCPSNAIVKSISFGFLTSGKNLAIYGSNTAYTAGTAPSDTSLGTVSGTGSSVSFDFSALESTYKYVAFKGTGSSTVVGTITVEYEALAALDSVTTSGQTTLFTAGNKWSYGGTLTAHYTGGKADATATPAYFKYGVSGINPTSAGTSITTNTTLTKAEHDGKYIYVVYTEDEITKYCSYQITVNYAAVTSVVIGVHAAEIGLNETYTDYLDTNKVSVTVNSQYANQGYEWIVSANTVSDDYVFDGSGLLSGDTEGTITLRCRSTSDNSKYDELVVTVTGDPTATFTPASVEGFVGKGTSVAFTYGNMDDTSLIAVTSSNAAVSVGAISASNENGTVAITFVSAGTATLSISYNGGSVLDTVTVTVSADSVVAVNWTASNIKVYSGAVLPVAIEDTWMVNYEMASGDTDFITYSDGDYSVKLGGSTITLPHTWVAEDDGKTLCVEYGGVQTSTVSVDVTQSLQAVMAPVEGEPTTKTWNASSGALGSSMGSTTGVTDSGSLTFDDDSTMSYTRTLEYLASGKSDYVAWSSPYIQFGSSNALETLELSVANSNVVTEVQIYCWAKNGATDVTVKVGGNVFDESKAAPSAAGSLTFSGSASGNIVITMEKASKTAGCAQYIASVAITTVESSGEETNIANVAGHEAAQKAVVAFAKAMNAAFDDTANCTDGVAAAWATASSAYSSNIANNASLSADEKAYAKNLIKYADAEYTDDTDDDYSYCLERAMATYEACIQKHGQTGFMSDVRPVSASSRITSLSVINGNGDTVTIIVAVSIVSVAAVGGYFFLRRRKEHI